MLYVYCRYCGKIRGQVDSSATFLSVNLSFSRRTGWLEPRFVPSGDESNKDLLLT